VEPQIVALLGMLAGTMVAGLRVTRNEIWDAHKRCPGCSASLPRGKHAEHCEFKHRL
jgi:hypothetical protein